MRVNHILASLLLLVSACGVTSGEVDEIVLENGAGKGDGTYEVYGSIPEGETRHFGFVCTDSGGCDFEYKANVRALSLEGALVSIATRSDLSRLAAYVTVAVGPYEAQDDLDFNEVETKEVYATANWQYDNNGGRYVGGSTQRFLTGPGLYGDPGIFHVKQGERARITIEIESHADFNLGPASFGVSASW